MEPCTDVIRAGTGRHFELGNAVSTPRYQISFILTSGFVASDRLLIARSDPPAARMALHSLVVLCWIYPEFGVRTVVPVPFVPEGIGPSRLVCKARIYICKIHKLSHGWNITVPILIVHRINFTRMNCTRKVLYLDAPPS